MPSTYERIPPTYVGGIRHGQEVEPELARHRRDIWVAIPSDAWRPRLWHEGPEQVPYVPAEAIFLAHDRRRYPARFMFRPALLWADARLCINGKNKILEKLIREKRWDVAPPPVEGAAHVVVAPNRDIAMSYSCLHAVDTQRSVIITRDTEPGYAAYKLHGLGWVEIHRVNQAQVHPEIENYLRTIQLRAQGV